MFCFVSHFPSAFSRLCVLPLQAPKSEEGEEEFPVFLPRLPQEWGILDEEPPVRHMLGDRVPLTS